MSLPYQLRPWRPTPLAPAFGPRTLRALDARFSPDSSHVRPCGERGTDEE